MGGYGETIMLTFEDGAQDIIKDSLHRYKKAFEEKFPFYLYLDVTKGGKWDVSVVGCKHLKKIIDKAIADNKPVYKPDDYDERNY